MHIYHPIDLAVGMLMLLLGPVGLCLDLSRIAKRKFKNTYGDWRSLGLSVWFITGGPAHLSRAFDLPHRESHLTSLLNTVANTGLVLVLLATILACGVRCRHATNTKTLASL